MLVIPGKSFKIRSSTQIGLLSWAAWEGQWLSCERYQLPPQRKRVREKCGRTGHLLTGTWVCASLAAQHNSGQSFMVLSAIFLSETATNTPVVSFEVALFSVARYLNPKRQRGDPATTLPR